MLSHHRETRPPAHALWLLSQRSQQRVKRFFAIAAAAHGVVLPRHRIALSEMETVSTSPSSFGVTSSPYIKFARPQVFDAHLLAPALWHSLLLQEVCQAVPSARRSRKNTTSLYPSKIRHLPDDLLRRRLVREPKLVPADTLVIVTKGKNTHRFGQRLVRLIYRLSP